LEEEREGIKLENEKLKQRIDQLEGKCDYSGLSKEEIEEIHQTLLNAVNLVKTFREE